LVYFEAHSSIKGLTKVDPAPEMVWPVTPAGWTAGATAAGVDVATFAGATEVVGPAHDVVLLLPNFSIPAA
jgi:hypothetical protein